MDRLVLLLEKIYKKQLDSSEEKKDAGTVVCRKKVPAKPSSFFWP